MSLALTLKGFEPGMIFETLQPSSVLRLQTGVPTDTIARCIRVKRVGRDDGARCFCSFLVVLACENDTSNLSLFCSLPPCNAIFRFLRCLLWSRNWELYFSRLRAKEVGSRRQFRIYEICSWRKNTSFFNIFEKICLI